MQRGKGTEGWTEESTAGFLLSLLPQALPKPILGAQKAIETSRFV